MSMERQWKVFAVGRPLFCSAPTAECMVRLLSASLTLQRGRLDHARTCYINVNNIMVIQRAAPRLAEAERDELGRGGVIREVRATEIEMDSGWRVNVAGVG